MRKNKVQRATIIIVAIAIIIVTISCVFVNQILRYNCLWWECAPKRNFTVFDLNLPKDYFPSNTEVHDLHFLREDGVSIEAASTTNYWKNGLAIYVVRRFATTKQAIRDYEYDAQIKFTRQSLGHEYTNLESYSSRHANSSVVRCGYFQNDFRCVYVARYEEFTVFFSGSIGDDEMASADFLGILAFIDNRMINLLEDSK